MMVRFFCIRNFVWAVGEERWDSRLAGMCGAESCEGSDETSGGGSDCNGLPGGTALWGRPQKGQKQRLQQTNTWYPKYLADGVVVLVAQSLYAEMKLDAVLYRKTASNFFCIRALQVLKFLKKFRKQLQNIISFLFRPIGFPRLLSGNINYVFLITHKTKKLQFAFGIRQSNPTANSKYLVTWPLEFF